MSCPLDWLVPLCVLCKLNKLDITSRVVFSEKEVLTRPGYIQMPVLVLKYIYKATAGRMDGIRRCLSGYYILIEQSRIIGWWLKDQKERSLAKYNIS